MSFYIFHRHRDCLVDHVGLICSLYSWWEDFGSSSLATLPLGFNCGFISTSACGSSIVHWGLLLRLPWRTWVCPCEGQVQRWSSCLGRRGSGCTRYSGGLQLRQQEIQCSRRVWQPVLANMLQYSCLENPLSDREAWQATVYRVAKSRTQPKRPCMQDTRLFFACGSSAPVRVA